MRFRWLMVVLFSTLVVFGCESPPSSATGGPAGSAKAEPEAVSIGVAIPSYVHAIAWIAADRGAFADGGVAPEITVTGGSAAALRTLIAKQSDVVLAGGDAVLKANRAGADVVVVASFVNRFYHRIVANKELATAKDLRGKTIGLPFLGGPQDMAVKHGLREHGLSYEDDVKVVGLGKELNRVAALKRGEIDATTSQTPDAKLEELGLHVVIDPTKADTGFPYMVMAVRRDVLSARRDAIVGALGALCEATAFYKDAKNEKASLAILDARLSGSDTEGASAARYATTVPSFLSYPPAPAIGAFELVGELTGKALSESERKMIDASVIEDARKTGHCKP